MRISGFTFARNTAKLYYPIRESIQSVLPVVDEFVIALGDGDPDDTTLQEIQSINSEKIRIIHTQWDLETYPRGMEHAHQTDIAKNACSGDWCFYIQADEVVHEKDYSEIIAACETYIDDPRVEGLLFDYFHFYGDYWHHRNHHGWYRNEIRIVRNDPDIHSYRTAQSFRRIPDFDGKNYKVKMGTYKLGVKKINAHIYHYGWVRPPLLMQSKSRSFATTHFGKAAADAAYEPRAEFDYGSLRKCVKFAGAHPAVMQERISRFDWKDKLNYDKANDRGRPKGRTDKLKYRFMSWIEKNLLGDRQIFAHSNWNVIR